MAAMASLANREYYYVQYLLTKHAQLNIMFQILITNSQLCNVPVWLLFCHLHWLGSVFLTRPDFWLFTELKIKQCFITQFWKMCSIKCRKNKKLFICTVDTKTMVSKIFAVLQFRKVWKSSCSSINCWVVVRRILSCSVSKMS